MMCTRRFVATALLFSASLVFSGCATMFDREYDDLTIESNPAGAEVYRGAEHIGTTPLTYRFDRVTFETPQITLRKDGYKPQTVTLQRTMAEPALLNFFFILTTSGVTSWGIDAASGNMIKYAPDSYLIDLQRPGDEGSASWRRRHLALAFVLVNQMNLMKDISQGGGEYLQAYYRLNVASVSTFSYTTFVQTVQQHSGVLLLHSNGYELHRALEHLFAVPEPAQCASNN